jgi:L-threonylcarbamoyladenylate synthase
MNGVIPLDRYDEAVELACSAILGGGVIVYPTETLYGIGANALDPGAVELVARVKRRPDRKPMLVIVRDAGAAAGLVASVPASARALMEAFWPGPLTIVFPAAAGLPAGLTAGTGTIGVRVPSSPFCLALLRACGVPVTSTSANLAGEPPPRTTDAIRRALGPAIRLYVDAGELPASPPSTVVSVAGPVPRLLREGAITLGRLREVTHDVAAA